jgi:hypothetical protein
MEDGIIPKLGTSKAKEIIMEQVITPRSLENVISWGDQPMHDPLEEVIDL